MSTTIAHPRPIPSGSSGRFAVGFVAVAFAVLGVGFGIVNSAQPVPMDASPSTARGADQLILQRAAELGYSQSTARGADQLILEQAAEYAALQAALAEAQSMSEGADQVLKQKAADLAAAEEPSKLEGRGPKSPLVVE